MAAVSTPSSSSCSSSASELDALSAALNDWGVTDAAAVEVAVDEGKAVAVVISVAVEVAALAGGG